MSASERKAQHRRNRPGWRHVSSSAMVGIAGVLAGGYMPLTLIRVGGLSDSGATLLGSALGAIAGIVAALVAIVVALRIEQGRLREYVAACVQDVLGAAIRIGDSPTPGGGEPKLSHEQWAEFRRRVQEFGRQCEIAEARLKRIDAVAYKLDGQSLRWLLDIEALIPTGRRVAEAVEAHASQMAVRLYGGPVPDDIGRQLGFITGMLGGLHEVLVTH